MKSPKKMKKEEAIDDGDKIVIHLGVELSEEKYNEVVQSVIAFMNIRWPEFSNNRFSN